MFGPRNRRYFVHSIRNNIIIKILNIIIITIFTTITPTTLYKTIKKKNTIIIIKRG